MLDHIHVVYILQWPKVWPILFFLKNTVSVYIIYNIYTCFKIVYINIFICKNNFAVVRCDITYKFCTSFCIFPRIICWSIWRYMETNWNKISLMYLKLLFLLKTLSNVFWIIVVFPTSENFYSFHLKCETVIDQHLYFQFLNAFCIDVYFKAYPYFHYIRHAFNSPLRSSLF